jgi:hypothetical protein
MMSCAYCGQQAATKIPSNPERVCAQHAHEFWTGLLTYAGDRSRSSEATPSTSDLRARAIAAAGPAPRAAERFAIALAS